MMRRSRTLKNNHKNETDRYELDWHEIADGAGDFTFKKTVWPSSFCFGYDSNHIDFYDKRQNRAIVIQGENFDVFNYKFKNSAKSTTFLP